MGIDSYIAGLSAIDAGDPERAIRELESAVARNSELRMARIRLGQLFLERREFDKAVPHLERAAELDPYTMTNHRNLGVSLQALARLPDAATAYLRALELDPLDYGSNSNLGLVYFALNQLDEAIRYLEQATRTSPEVSRGWSNLGVVHDARGNHVLAEASYRRALELEPASQYALLNLTSNLITQRKPTDAVAAAEQLVRTADTPVAHKRHGDALTLAQQWDAAARAYDAAFTRDQTYTAALNGKAQMYLARYQAGLEMDQSLRQLAVATWRQSLAIDRNQPSVDQNVRRWTTASVPETR